MKVIVRLKETSQPLIFEEVTNTYEKGSLFCIYIQNKNLVKKIPMNNIFDIEEEYKQVAKKLK